MELNLSCQKEGIGQNIAERKEVKVTSFIDTSGNSYFQHAYKKRNKKTSSQASYAMSNIKMGIKKLIQLSSAKLH